MKRFTDRVAAGRELANLLRQYERQPDVLVLGLPRGGVPVAFEVAQSLHAPLDVMIVRKLGAPGQPELAIGAVASGGVTVINEDLLAWFPDPKAIERVEAAERIELERRERAYRGGRPPLSAQGRTVILVDDGAATGASMRAAVQASRKLEAKKIVVALPVASTDAYQMLRKEADEVVCVSIPLAFYAVGQWYEEFTQTTDKEVTDLLARASAWAPGAWRPSAR
ncbi:MAG TPA: phosphoribosyltransferase [Steroidobacter sp.]|nr:phosphoribosyltransferase [Steroidobacteraceae bacterium]HLS79888.1 phosphoribosyltransferase [Steroidobacter sp.]